MDNSTFYLILLLFYATLALVFIVFNINHHKKYINLMSISHIFGILTTIFTFTFYVFNNSWILNNISVLCFLFGNFAAILALNNFLNNDISKKIKYGALSLIIIDILSLNFFHPLSVFLHKIVLMLIYIYFGIKIIKEKDNSFNTYCFGISSIIFPIIQMIFGFSWVFILEKHYYVDIVAYILQTLIFSLCMILLTLAEEERSYNNKVQRLQEEVNSTQKRIQEIYELDKLKTEFIANISHELRTPINILFSSVQLLELNCHKAHNKENDKNLVYLTNMKNNCYRLIKLTNNLIDMSKIEAGFLEVKLRNYNIVSIIEDITMSIVDFAGDKNIHVEFDTEFEEKIIACDIEMIERIMLNLLSNSIKFTKNTGKIEVYISEDKNNIIISVKDNGIGIPKHMHDKIYNRFTQVTDTFTRVNEGSGIGLSLVKSLVEMHNGEIKLESEHNKGCKFKILLPKTIIENEEFISTEGKEINMKKIEIEFSDIYM
ncbi:MULTISPECIES: sensor histidine kinase [unclassified Clostridium]|uniref:sensor histidine kinase n=1 Tax=unclassified Clostridium TaxID=2614128 RepID=UPI0025BCCF84|nr:MULTISPECIES: HAMP domain-containing sensor histidine kinase [unclassified Clostridium]